MIKDQLMHVMFEFDSLKLLKFKKNICSNNLLWKNFINKISDSVWYPALKKIFSLWINVFYVYKGLKFHHFQNAILESPGKITFFLQGNSVHNILYKYKMFTFKKIRCCTVQYEHHYKKTERINL